MAKSTTPKSGAGASASARKTSAPTPLQSGKPAPDFLQFFTDEVKDLYWAENHLVKNLPKMAKSATSSALAAAIEEHLEITRTHVARLEQVFAALGEKPLARKCDAMEGLVKEGEGCIENTADGSAIRDVAIIMASQKVEHYEISAYGSLATLARTIGLDELAAILEETLGEEKDADQKLTGLAESEINYEAVAE